MVLLSSSHLMIYCNKPLSSGSRWHLEQLERQEDTTRYGFFCRQLDDAAHSSSGNRISSGCSAKPSRRSCERCRPHYWGGSKLCRCTSEMLPAFWMAYCWLPVLHPGRVATGWFCSRRAYQRVTNARVCIIWVLLTFKLTTRPVSVTSHNWPQTLPIVHLSVIFFLLFIRSLPSLTFWMGSLRLS